MKENLNFVSTRDLENSVGIRKYSTNTPGIQANTKTYPTDFIVCEITPQGEVLNINLKEGKEDFIDGKTSKYRKVKFTAFHLVKKNQDTILAAQKISQSLQISPNIISWAGLKDNYALTVQRMSIKGNYINKLIEIRNQFEKNFIKNVLPVDRQIKIGDLWGNNFQIILRNVHCSNKENIINEDNIQQIINSTAKQIDEKGFPNYYGLQRFGSHRPNSHLIGKYLFLKCYKEAVEELLFISYPNEFEYIKKCRNELNNTQDYRKAFENFPHSLFYERILIENLIKKPEKYADALKRLPKPLINLLFSAYQSFLFNVTLSKRCELGDLLHIPRKGDKISILLKEKGMHSPVYYDYGKYYDEFLDKTIKMARATIMCPVIGYETDVTRGYFAPIIKELLKNEQFPQESFKNTKFSSFVYKGTKRPIFVKPLSFSAQYIEKKKDSDLSHIKIDFSLPKGTYATMLLREFIKK